MVFKKKEKKIPTGFNSVNEFFDYLYKKEDLIWMGQNTNHLQKDKHIENVSKVNNVIVLGAKVYKNKPYFFQNIYRVNFITNYQVSQ